VCPKEQLARVGLQTKNSKEILLGYSLLYSSRFGCLYTDNYENCEIRQSNSSKAYSSTKKVLRNNLWHMLAGKIQARQRLGA